MHGLPETLTSDNGGQFTSNEMESFLKINGITHNRTTLLWLQANGQVERINRFIKKAIQAAINEGCNWQHEFDTFLLIYRNTLHCTTGETPSFLFFFLVPLATSYQLFQVLKMSQDTIML